MQTNDEKNVTSHQGVSAEKSGESHQGAPIGSERGHRGFVP